MITNQASGNIALHFMSALKSYIANFGSFVAERYSKRIEAANARFARILELENRREFRLGQSKLNLLTNLSERSPDGWLCDEAQSLMLPLYSGGNLFDGLELRLSGASVYCAGKVFSSNDRIESGGRSYLIKLLPYVYRSEGEKK